jgi:G:T-mismatch repair DNA endonuclease (very short patch repair protein)
MGTLNKGKPKLKLRGYKQSEEHLVARLGNGSIRSSKEELSLVPIMGKLGFRHTGEGAFWRRWPDGTIHNPDFVNEDARVVVEYFGSYWHEPEEVAHAQRQWKQIGYDCLVIWDYEREAFLADPDGWVAR